MTELAHHERRDRLHPDANGGRPWRRKIVALALVLAVGPSALLLTSPAAGAASRAKDFQHRPVGQAPCPEGKSRSATLAHSSFERSIPQRRFDNGWFVSSTSTPNGSHIARSYLDGTTSDPSDYFFLPPVKTTAGQDTRLAFATRGNAPTRRYLVQVNSASRWYAGTSSWRGRVLNVTKATRDEGGWLNPWFEHRRTAGKATRWDMDNLQIYTCRANATTRIRGADEYQTGAWVADRFPTDQSVVYVAGGLREAIVAAARAGSRNAPVLLVKKSSIPSPTKSALTRLNPNRIVIVGGTDTVSQSVATNLASYAGSGVSRWGGSTPAATSAAVAATYDAGKNDVYIANAATTQRALPAAALAARRSSPLLLTGKTSLPTAVSEQLQRIAPGEIVIIGGTNVVSTGVEKQLAQYSSNVRRIGTGNRYQTAAAIAAEFPRSVGRSYLVSATWPATGVTAVALDGKHGAPVLTTTPNGIPKAIGTRLSWLQENHGWLVGGKIALGSIVRDRYGRTLP